MSRRAAVFGAAGQLGVELVRELKHRGYETTSWDRAQVDITDGAAVESALANFDAQVVLNAAAYNQVDVAEKEPQAAYLVNALAVRNLALACRQIDAQLVHFSTDYVFDGEAGRSYVEEDATHPLGAYAVSKLSGELYAQAYLERVLIVRTSGVFGPAGIRTARGNFVELMLRLAQSPNPIRVVEDHVASPTFAPALASRTIDLMDAGKTGVFHIGGGAPYSWFEFARLLFEAAGVKPALSPTNEREYRTPARRPRYSALSNAKMERAGVEPMPSLPKALETYFATRGK
ncbi:MAG TPA: dTDP-4-dehydrorhamnose reductase [Candidatus Acidoferrum sp.]|nr:dTDP-4-dehydrorhamnose reductase [Candidatus Acidoferrum sp.]